VKPTHLARVSVGLALGLVMSACGGDATTESTTSTTAATTTTAAVTTTTAVPTTTVVEPVTVKVVTLPFITFAPYYIGVEEGYYAKYGIDVELVNMTVQEEILPALSSGQVDVSSGLLSAGMFNAIDRGAEIVITADKGIVDPDGCVNWSILGRSDLIESGALDSPDQLAGLTVNIVPATWLEYYLHVVLESGGLTLDDIEKVNISSPAVPDALNTQQIDVAVNSEPWVTILANSGHLPVLALPQEVLSDESGAVMLYGPTLLGENHEVGVRFMAGYLESVAQYSEGKTEGNLDIIQTFTELDRGLLDAMCWPAINPTGEVSVGGVDEFQDFAVARGYQDAVVSADDYYDGSYLTEAAALLEADG
jgi:NitT/TauT family transport system substrate-binding protein